MKELTNLVLMMAILMAILVAPFYLWGGPSAKKVLSMLGSKVRGLLTSFLRWLGGHFASVSAKYPLITGALVLVIMLYLILGR